MISKAEIKKVCTLDTKKGRDSHNLILIEGKRLIEQVLNSDYNISQVWTTEDFNHKNSDFINRFSNVEIDSISDQDLKRISATQNPSGIIGVMQPPKGNIKEMNQRIVILDNISDPGNLGTILRTANWFGVSNILLSEHCVDPYNTKVIRSAMGAHFAVNLYKEVELDQFSETHHIIGAHTNGIDITKYDFPKKSVLVFGNEAHGISDVNKKKVNKFIKIKKRGVGESLNIATAASIVMHMIKRN